MTSAQNKRHGPLLRLFMAFIGLVYLYLSGGRRTDTYSSEIEVELILTEEFEHLSQSCGPCVEYS